MRKKCIIFSLMITLSLFMLNIKVNAKSFTDSLPSFNNLPYSTEYYFIVDQDWNYKPSTGISYTKNKYFLVFLKNPVFFASIDSSYINDVNPYGIGGWGYPGLWAFSNPTKNYKISAIYSLKYNDPDSFEWVLGYQDGTSTTGVNGSSFMWPQEGGRLMATTVDIYEYAKNYNTNHLLYAKGYSVSPSSFVVDFSHGEVCDKENKISEYVHFDFYNYMDDRPLTDFKYYIGSSLDNYHMEEINLEYFKDENNDDVGRYEFLSYFNATYRIKVYDPDREIYLIDKNYEVYNSYFNKHIDTHDVYVFPGKDINLAFISSFPTSGTIILSDDYGSLYIYNLTTKKIDESVQFNSYCNNDNETIFEYDMSNYTDSILVIKRKKLGLFKKYDRSQSFFVPKGSYVSFGLNEKTSLFGNIKDFDFKYKDENGNIISSSKSEYIDDNEKNISNFSNNFFTHVKSFYSEFAFIGNGLSTLIDSLTPKLAYTLFFMFGLVILAMIIKIWL